ncbi:phosphoglycerate kinase [Kitasatospora purpeofusca]|uniref:phosphoglycerate kinase n=1 Tax=Kitasatospora purpeofusca TaxID=67352 RepID=UPI002257DC52|nr:phosphoglycerate kinase [Kitasatospora purpeofusca]MCX4684408.1 phosphoglycerate kinase [Kitasatospora purpeofusca]
MRLLADHTPAPGERWIYSAGFNAGPALADTGRIDVELADLARLSDAGARTALLSHQGSAKDGSARHLDYLADYLTRRLGRPVRYLPENTTARARTWARELAPGGIALFGNTRLDPGEERGDPELARALAGLGDRVAIGGFSKAHRRHASNTGLLDHLPGWAAAGLVGEARALDPWAAGAGGGTAGGDGPSVAVLGGVKPEKTLIGLRGLTRTHHLVIPGGVVLNTLLAVTGHRIGRSELGSDPEDCARVAREVLARTGGAGIHLPRVVVAAGPDGTLRHLPLDRGVPDDHTIVDFEVQPGAIELLRRAGRVLVAGTPGRHAEGNRYAAAAVLAARAHAPGGTLLLGGDTVAELPWDGPRSTGGGSALQYLVEGTCAVFEALAANAARTDRPGADPEHRPRTDPTPLRPRTDATPHQPRRGAAHDDR